MNGDVDPATGNVIPGALSQLGHGSAGVSAKFTEKAKEWTDAIQTSLTPEQSKLLKPRLDAMFNNTMERLTDHEAREMRNGDVQSYMGVAEISKSNALSAWSNGTEFEQQLNGGSTSLAKALSAQGVPPEQIKAEVQKYQNGASVDRVQTAIKFGKYNDARLLLTDSKFADPRLTPEQRADLAKLADSEQQAKIHRDRAEAAFNAQQLHLSEAAKLSKQARNVNWANPVEAEKYFAAANSSPSPTAAEEYTDKGKQLQREFWREQNTAQTAKQKIARNRLESELSLGIKVGSRGELITPVPDERHAAIDAAVRSGDLLFSQGKGLHDMVDSDHAKAMQDLAAEVLTTVAPEARKYLAYKDSGTELVLDASGRPAIGKPGQGKPPFDPTTEVFKRKFDTGRRTAKYITGGYEGAGLEDEGPVETVPVIGQEVVTISDVSDALRLVGDMMRSDKTMTHSKAVEKVREILKPAQDAAAKEGIRKTLEMQRILQRNTEMQWKMSYLDRSVPADNTPMTMERLRQSSISRVFGSKAPISKQK